MIFLQNPYADWVGLCDTLNAGKSRVRRLSSEDKKLLVIETLVSTYSLLNSSHCDKRDFMIPLSVSLWHLRACHTMANLQEIHTKNCE